MAVSQRQNRGKGDEVVIVGYSLISVRVLGSKKQKPTLAELSRKDFERLKKKPEF